MLLTAIEYTALLCDLLLGKNTYYLNEKVLYQNANLKELYEERVN